MEHREVSHPRGEDLEMSGATFVNSDEEDSFVVLSSNSFNEDDRDDSAMAPIRTAKIHDMQSLIGKEISQINSSTTMPKMPEVADTLNNVATSIANLTLSPDSSYEEIQKQVENLIKENEKLKHTIAQNNVSMKTQYDRILAWKEEVNEVLASYKSKFTEAKNAIDKLKEENGKLANDVEKYKNIKELQDEEIINLKSKGKEREKMSYISSSSEQNMAQFDLQVAIEKIKDLETALAEANIKNAQLVSENETLTQKLVTTPELEKEMDEKLQEINNLKMQLETRQNQQESFDDNIIKLKNEIARLQTELYNEKQVNQRLTESASTVSSYECHLQSSENKISKLQEENSELKRNKASLMQEVTNLKIHVQKSDPNLEEKYGQVRQQLMNSQITITALEQEVQGKIKDIEELRKLLQSASKTDEMYALNEQLAVYKSDFEAERESKNAIKRERDQIAEDLQNLQKRNKQLQQEVESLRAGPKQEEFSCPKCSFGFSTYQSLENHVHRCLDLEGFP